MDRPVELQRLLTSKHARSRKYFTGQAFWTKKQQGKQGETLIVAVADISRSDRSSHSFKTTHKFSTCKNDLERDARESVRDLLFKDNS
jgi:hypothetical protein